MRARVLDDASRVPIVAILLALLAILVTGAVLFFAAAVMSVHGARRRYAARIREAQKPGRQKM
jgi:hypothetical protein